MGNSKDFVIEEGVLTDYQGDGGNVVVPDGVTEIGMKAFLGCSKLTSITLPESVTEIGWGAFSGCSSLTSVVIPESVVQIGGEAFKDCSSLTSIVIPKGVTEIGIKTFSGCKSLTQIEIPENVVRIREYAFAKCDSLQKIEIHKYMQSIDGNAFFGCLGLKCLKIHPECNKKAYDIYASPIHCCYNLEYLFLSDNETQPLYTLIDINDYPSGVGVEYSFQKRRESIKEDLKVISRSVPLSEIPSSKREPYVRGFLEYSDEYRADIAKGYLDYLGRMIKKWQPYITGNTKALSCVLRNCLIKKTMVDEWLGDIQKTGDAEKISMMTDYIRENFGAGFEEYFDRIEAKEKEEKKREAQKKNDDKKKKQLEEKRKDSNADLKDVWSIKKHETTCTLANYKGSAETLIIPESYGELKITMISKTYKDKGYNSVKKIVLPDSVETLTDHCFSNCKKLEEIHLGKGLKHIGKETFMGCSKLKEIVIPEGVGFVPKWMFRGCGHLEKIVFENKKRIVCDDDSNFLGGASKAKVYVHKGTELIDFRIKPERFIYIEDEQNL